MLCRYQRDRGAYKDRALERCGQRRADTTCNTRKHCMPAQKCATIGRKNSFVQQKDVREGNPYISPGSAPLLHVRFAAASRACVAVHTYRTVRPYLSGAVTPRLLGFRAEGQSTDGALYCCGGRVSALMSKGHELVQALSIFADGRSHRV